MNCHYLLKKKFRYSEKKPENLKSNNLSNNIIKRKKDSFKSKNEAIASTKTKEKIFYELFQQCSSTKEVIQQLKLLLS